MGNVFTLLLFMLPLSLDTFAIAAAVGANRLSGWSKWRISMIFVIFEGGTPLANLGLGSSIGQAVGSVAEYISGSLLILLGGYLWWSNTNPDDDDEATKSRRLINACGLALIGLALSISLEELAIGFSFDLGANVATPTTFIIVITIQALVASQLGLLLGTWIRCYPLSEALIRTKLVSTRSAVYCQHPRDRFSCRHHASPCRGASSFSYAVGRHSPAFGTSLTQLNQSELLRQTIMATASEVRLSHGRSS